MTRPARSLPLVATLALGVLVGMMLGRGGNHLSAQIGRTDPPQPAASSNVSNPSRSAAPVAVQGVQAEDAVYAQLERQYQLFEPINRTFELVARAVSPSVVHIVSHKVDPHRERYDETGSGVIVRGQAGRDRFVLTNNHVVEGSAPSEIWISLHDGRTIRPERIWRDEKADIAVLKLSGQDLPPAARLGDSDDTPVGSWVLALGSPFGLTHSVSQGIISARGRHEEELQEEGMENQDFLQTDAAINPGNSGGPLVNLKGEVIGINTCIASNHGGSEGVGFSIPINLAKWILEQLITQGKVSRGALGVSLAEVSPREAESIGMRRPRGARVSSVYGDSPAALAGLQNGDIILSFNGLEVSDTNHLINLVSMSAIGRPARLLVYRDRRELQVDVTIGEKDAVLALAPGPDARPVPAADAGQMLRRPARPPGVESTPTFERDSRYAPR